ncbi:MAG: cobalamin-independent methionine synthase II family protein [Candidatus Sulfotelmatobacter sp.]
MANRFLTTHAGSLPRPVHLATMLAEVAAGTRAHDCAVDDAVRGAVIQSVADQVKVGIDIANDGEMGKINYADYAAERLTGFSAERVPRTGISPDLVDFPEYAKTLKQKTAVIASPICEGPVKHTGSDAVQKDCEHLRAAAEGKGVSELFLTAASPGVITRFAEDRFYGSHEAYLADVAEAMKFEYDAIHRAGFILQLDCPDLTGNRPIKGAGEGTSYINLHVEALNHATRDIPPDRMRIHLCWGNYEGPHHTDIPLRRIVDSVLRARPSGLSFEAANPRHQHEWVVFTEIKVPEDKVLIPGVIDTTTHFIEHPELVAQRLVRFASIVGKRRVIAGTDCGMATFSGWNVIDPRISLAKLSAMSEGAALATLHVT